VGEKHGMIIDVDLQGPSVDQEGGGEEIQVGEQEFPGRRVWSRRTRGCNRQAY
jgi:hypothetical protein